MITHRGASDNLNPKDLPQDLFEENNHLHLSGYTFSGGTRRETAHEALRLARENNMTISVDPSSVPLLADIGSENFLRWTAGADIIFPNHEEGALLAATEDPNEIADALLDHYPAIVLKLGPRGALFADAAGTRLRLPASRTKTLDTTGAGDALCAGFLAEWIQHSQPSEALKSGLDTAARVVGQIGGRPSI